MDTASRSTGIQNYKDQDENSSSKIDNDLAQLARKCGVTLLQAQCIAKAFNMFAKQDTACPRDDRGILRCIDARRCLLSLDLPFDAAYTDILDPTHCGAVYFEPFFELAALLTKDIQNDAAKSDHSHTASDSEISSFNDDVNNRNGKALNTTTKPKTTKRSKSSRASKPRHKLANDSTYSLSTVGLTEAFNLFTQNSTAPVITLAHLRRVADEIHEEVDDNTLKEMICLANGEDVSSGWKKGVRRDEFAQVLHRAGIR